MVYLIWQYPTYSALRGRRVGGSDQTDSGQKGQSNGREGLHLDGYDMKIERYGRMEMEKGGREDRGKQEVGKQKKREYRIEPGSAQGLL